MPTKKRLDVLLREWGMAPSRAKAQELLDSGVVEAFEKNQWHAVRDGAALFEPSDRELIRLQANPILDFVSRGGRKLSGALAKVGMELKGWRALDIGQSTGGFSDCLLKAGADSVVGVDVGHDQLAKELKNHPRLKSFEGINARELRRSTALAEDLARPFDLVVIDVSFISLSPILPEAVAVLRAGGQLLALVKPQFELSTAELNKKGVVTDLELHGQVREKILTVLSTLGMRVLDFFPSDVVGQDGNQEYFVYAEKP